MVTSEVYLRQLEDLDGRIAALQGYKYELEAYPRQGGLWPRLKRALFVHLRKHEADRQIHQLALHRSMARNCYAAMERREEVTLAGSGR